MTSPFNVKLTADFYDAAGNPKYRDLGLSVFESAPQIAVSKFAEHRNPIAPTQLTGVNGVIVLTPAVTRESVSDAKDLLAVVTRDRRRVGAQSLHLAVVELRKRRLIIVHFSQHEVALPQLK